MGVNISLVKIVNISKEELFDQVEVPYYETEDQRWFDFMRHSGDREFISENEFIYIDDQLPFEEREIARPKNFEKCREWIKENIVESNQSRLLGALDKMAEDNSLGFRWSY